MCLDDSWLFARRRILLCFPQLLDERHRLALEAALESSARASVKEFHQLLGRAVQQSIELSNHPHPLALLLSRSSIPAFVDPHLNASVRVLSERCKLEFQLSCSP